MKFLCIPCDSPMKLQSVGPPDRGSLSVVYSCPECGYEMAMLTNAYETQVVQSLGVRIGPDASAERLAGAAGVRPASDQGQTPAEAAGRCPFSAMIPGADNARAVHTETPAVRWTAAAEARLAKVPDFVRPMARTGIEKFARDNGSSVVDETILDAAREFFGM